MLHPILLIHGNKRQHINRCFKYIHRIAFPNPVKTVSWIAAFHISLKRFPLLTGSSLMGMAWNSIHIKPHKNCIVVFGVFINHMSSCKYRHDFRIQTACLYQICKSPVHRPIGLRKYKWFFRFLFLLHAFPICFPLLPSQQHSNCIRKTLIVKHPHKINGTASLFCCMIIPLVSSYCNTVITGQPFFSSRTKQFLSLSGKKIFQIYRIGPLLMFFCKINKSSHAFLLCQ